MEKRKLLHGKIKKFDQKLYNKYDLPARKKLIEQLGGYLIDNPDIYAEDLIINDDECAYKYLEIQVCANWLDGAYPYKLPFVYERKAHFSDKTLFIILSKDLSRGLMFPKTKLNPTPRRLKKFSRYFVYEVEWRYVLNVYVDSLDVDLFKNY